MQQLQVVEEATDTERSAKQGPNIREVGGLHHEGGSHQQKVTAANHQLEPSAYQREQDQVI